MGILWITGLGPGGPETITMQTMQVIEQADKVILRTAVHPVVAQLSAAGIAYDSCDCYYENGGSFKDIYDSIAGYVWEEAARTGDVCYCVPGHPLVAEETVQLLKRKAEAAAVSVLRGRSADAATDTSAIPPVAPTEIRVLSAVSFLDALFVSLGIDPVKESLVILDATDICDAAGCPDGGDQSGKGGLRRIPESSCLFAQVYHPLIAGELKLALLDAAPPDAEVWIAYHAGIEGEEDLLRCPLAELDHFKGFDHLTSVYLPRLTRDGASNRLVQASPQAERQPDYADAGITDTGIADTGHRAMAGPSGSQYPLDALVGVFRQLLGPDGCPWDKKQTHTTLKPYLLEEAQEALDAIDALDMPHLKEELGDVLMQIVFHCALAEGRGDFDLNDVIQGITDKMIRRHPHVFGDEKAETPDDVAVLWQRIKAAERQGIP